MSNELELDDIRVKLANLQHQHKILEIQAKEEADLKVEDRKAQHALELEQQRRQTNLAVEDRKGKWALGLALGGITAGILVKVIGDKLSMTERDVDRASNSWKRLR